MSLKSKIPATISMEIHAHQAPCHFIYVFVVVNSEPNVTVRLNGSESSF